MVSQGLSYTAVRDHTTDLNVVSQGLNSTAVREQTTDLNVVWHGAQFYSSERPYNWLECGLTRDLILQQWETKQLTWMWSHMGLNSTAVRDQTNDLNVVSHGAQFYSSERPNNWLECGLTQAQFYSSERPNNWLECGLIQGSILQSEIPNNWLECGLTRPQFYSSETK